MSESGVARLFEEQEKAILKKYPFVFYVPIEEKPAENGNPAEYGPPANVVFRKEHDCYKKGQPYELLLMTINDGTVYKGTAFMFGGKDGQGPYKNGPELAKELMECGKKLTLGELMEELSAA
jgi:hypothetical protein